MSIMNPNVNSNGTSREELIRQRVKVRTKLEDALEALAEMNPNGRDYQGLADYATAYSRDRDIQTERSNTIVALMNNLLEEALNIQLDAKESR